MSLFVKLLSIFTNWNKNLTETLTNFFLHNYSWKSLSTWLPREESPWKVRCVRFEIKFPQQIKGTWKKSALQKQWTMYVTIDERLLSVAADCCRKERWWNLFQSLKAKYLPPHLFVDRTPTDCSTVICTEVSVLVKIVLYKVLIKLSSVLSGHICFDIILRQAKTFKCYSITSFIRFKDALVLYSKMKSFRRTRAQESKNVNKHWRFCTLQWPCRSWM